MRCAMFCASASTSAFGTANSALRRRADKRLSAHLRLDLALELEPEIRRDLRPELVDAAAGDAERLRERRVDRRNMRFGNDLRRQRELGVLSGDFLAVVVGGEREPERLGLAFGDARHRRLELGQHRRLADDDGEILRLPARELDAVDASGEIDDHAVALRGGAVDVLVACALLAQHVERLVDVLRARPRRPGARS